MSAHEDAPAWPDPARPGVPLNPERDGWHWLEDPSAGIPPRCYRWVPHDTSGYWDGVIVGGISPRKVADIWRYLGPCLTPAEVAAQVAAAAEAMREKAAQKCNYLAWSHPSAPSLGPEQNCLKCEAAIASLPIEHHDALAAAIAAAQQQQRLDTLQSVLCVLATGSEASKRVQRLIDDIRARGEGGGCAE